MLEELKQDFTEDIMVLALSLNDHTHRHVGAVFRGDVGTTTIEALIAFCLTVL